MENSDIQWHFDWMYRTLTLTTSLHLNAKIEILDYPNPESWLPKWNVFYSKTAYFTLCVNGQIFYRLFIRLPVRIFFVHSDICFGQLKQFDGRSNKTFFDFQAFFSEVRMIFWKFVWFFRHSNGFSDVQLTLWTFECFFVQTDGQNRYFHVSCTCTLRPFDPFEYVKLLWFLHLKISIETKVKSFTKK